MVLILFALTRETESSIYVHVLSHWTVRFHVVLTLFRNYFDFARYNYSQCIPHVWQNFFSVYSILPEKKFDSFFMHSLFDSSTLVVWVWCWSHGSAVDCKWKWMFLFVTRQLWNQRYVMAMDKIVWNNLPWKRLKIERQDRNDLRLSHKRMRLIETHAMTIWAAADSDNVHAHWC